MTNFIATLEPLLVSRKSIKPLLEYLNLPVGSLGEIFIETHQVDTNDSDDVIRWWNSLSPSEQQICECLACIAMPILLADVRIYYNQTIQIRTWVLTGKVEEEAPWLFLAPVHDGQEYKIQPVEQREVVVNSLFAYLQSGGEVWEYEISFNCTVREFSVLISLADIYSRVQYASLILHQPVPASFSVEELLQAYDNVTNYVDQRYLFWSVVHILPESLRHIDHNTFLSVINELIQGGLMYRDEDKFGWTESGLFFVSSLHQRLCTLAIDFVGYTGTGRIGTQGALFIRTQNLLWFFNLDLSPNSLVSVVSISLDKAYKLLDEIFTPVGEPQMEFSVQSFEKKTTSSSPESRPEALTTKYCLVCHQPLQDGDKFCTHCGTPVIPAEPPKPEICPQCGHTPTPGAKFCGNCGFVLENKS